MTAAELLEKLLILRIKHGALLDTMPVWVEEGPVCPAYEVATESVELRHILGENVLYIGRGRGA